MISDIHGNLSALNAVLNDARDSGAEKFIFLGDYSLGLFEPNETLDALREIKDAVFISGNEDRVLVDDSSIHVDIPSTGQFHAKYWYRDYLTPDNIFFLKSLEKTIVLRQERVPPVFIFHEPEIFFNGTAVSMINPHFYALGRDSGKFNSYTFPDFYSTFLSSDHKLTEILPMLEDGVYAFGHTHIQWHTRLGGKLLINAGSAGLPLDFCRKAAYTLLSFTDGEWIAQPRRVFYDVELTLDRFKSSYCMRSVPVWCGIIHMELETAREQATPFLQFTEAFARQAGDLSRPFSKKVWEASYKSWVNSQEDIK